MSIIPVPVHPINTIAAYSSEQLEGSVFGLVILHCQYYDIFRFLSQAAPEHLKSWTIEFIPRKLDRFFAA